jgi:hypothetical protein
VARIHLTFSFFFAFSDGVNIVDDFELKFDIDTLHIVFTALLKVKEESFVRFPLRDILNVNCWLATIPPPKLDEEGFRLPGQNATADLVKLALKIKELNLGLECLNCTSPKLIELQELLAAPGASEDVTDLTNYIVEALLGHFGGGFLRDTIDRLLVEAPKHCGHTDNYDPDAPPFNVRIKELEVSDSTVYIAFLLTILIPLLLTMAVALLVRRAVLKRHKQWLEALPSEKVFLMQQKQDKENQMETEINVISKSLFESEEIPIHVRYLVPLIVIINIGFFLSGHLSYAGTAHIDFRIAGEYFQLSDFYTFSIAQSILDMWHAGGEELAICILLFAGIWPYTKQLITLALWLLSPEQVSCTRRGQFLLWLDILAKWSMLDILTLLIMYSGFR